MSVMIKIHGILTHTETYGKGKIKIVMLHGWGGSSQSFSSLAKKLAQNKNYQILVPDLPGFGRSSPPPKTGWNRAHYTQWLEEFLQEFDIKNPVFYGHSFGCRIIIDYLLKHPEHQEKIILTGAAGIKWPPTPREKISKFLSKKFAFLKKYIPQKLYKLILRKIFKAHDWAEVSEGMKKTFQNTITEPDFRHRLPEIKNEVLLLWGRKDRYTPLKSAFVFDEKLPHSHLHIFEQGRHGIHYTHKDEIAGKVIEFLNF